MASEIQKVSVVDSRILQNRPKFAVEKGPLSLTNVPYRAITQSVSQMTFNCIIPSESVFVDRAVDWQSTVYGSVDVQIGSTATAAYPIAVYGRDCALAPFPLHQMCATMSVTVNDTTTVVNTNDVANVLFRLSDYKKNRKIRTCPSMLDRYYDYPVQTLGDTKALTGTSSAVTYTGAFTGTGSGSSTTLTITAVASGAVANGMLITGSTFAAGTVVLGQLTGTAGGVGTYLLSTSGTVSSGSLTGAGPYLTIPAGTTSTSGVPFGSDPTVTNSPLNSFLNEHNVDEKPNGSWGDFQWCQSDGSAPAAGATTAVLTVASGTTTYNFNYGQPVFASGSVTSSSVYRLYFKFKSTERLLMSPFIFADDHEVSTGLFGIQNIQLLMNFQNPIAAGRMLRWNGSVPINGALNTVTVTNQQFQNFGGNTPFANPTVNIQYLTPSLDVPLPAKNIVPYQDFPRYISQQSLGSIPPTVFSANVGSSVTGTPLNSQTITLSAIPDLLCIFVKPNLYVTTPGGATPDPLQGDWFLPITGISINFDNYAGLLSAHSQEQLYRMSVMNGLEMDFDQWRGYANGAQAWNANSSNPNQYWGNTVPLTGGPLILKPGRDIVLQAGQAPSLVGNFSLQFTLYVQNQTGVAQTSCQVYVIAINSGYLETIKGSSRIIKGILTEQDILSAPMGPGSSDARMERYVGAGMISEASEAPQMGKHHKSKHGHKSKMDKYR